MEYEYVALYWTTHYPGGDAEFEADKHRLLGEGWQTDVQARFEPKRNGGACIMRRPKDEPRMWTEKEIQKLITMSQPGPRADGGWLGPPLSDQNRKNKKESNG